ncbi:MAG: hypothetical protein RLZZ301_104 [Bacteroidota bacterium]|jgi:3'(2'), 5'-bisphosphate nucleotidase
MQIPEHFQAAITASIKASAAILEIYQEDVVFDEKTDGSPVTKADFAASIIIEKHLAPFGIPFTGEESEKVPFEERRQWAQSWCVDPLDGTKEFIKKNDEFAINIALINEGKPEFGLIAAPVQQEILMGSQEMGVYLFSFEAAANPTQWKKIEAPLTFNQPLMMACSRSHHSGPVLQMINELKVQGHEIDFLKKGSSLKFFDLALGKADVYPRYAPTMEWDIAAGQAILEALGGEVVHAETGQALSYNKANLVNPYFIARTKAMRKH